MSSWTATDESVTLCTTFILKRVFLFTSQTWRTRRSSLAAVSLSSGSLPKGQLSFLPSFPYHPLFSLTSRTTEIRVHTKVYITNLYIFRWISSLYKKEKGFHKQKKSVIEIRSLISTKLFCYRYHYVMIIACQSTLWTRNVLLVLDHLHFGKIQYRTTIMLVFL